MFFIKPTNIELLKESEIASQEEYTYYDNDGEEHEEESLIEVTGIGKILTYKDIYFASIAMFLIAIIIGAIVFEGGIETRSEDSLCHIIFANCVLGVLLIWLTSKETIVSTIFFWLGIIAAYIARKLTNDTRT